MRILTRTSAPLNQPPPLPQSRAPPLPPGPPPPPVRPHMHRPSSPAAPSDVGCLRDGCLAGPGIEPPSAAVRVGERCHPLVGTRHVRKPHRVFAMWKYK
eukprot:scaffold12976_cov138-Isochrysis_galbana.AAC.1